MNGCCKKREREAAAAKKKRALFFNHSTLSFALFFLSTSALPHALRARGDEQRTGASPRRRGRMQCGSEGPTVCAMKNREGRCFLKRVCGGGLLGLAACPPFDFAAHFLSTLSGCRGKKKKPTPNHVFLPPRQGRPRGALPRPQHPGLVLLCRCGGAGHRSRFRDGRPQGRCVDARGRRLGRRVVVVASPRGKQQQRSALASRAWRCPQRLDVSSVYSPPRKKGAFWKTSCHRPSRESELRAREEKKKKKLAAAVARRKRASCG